MRKRASKCKCKVCGSRAAWLKVSRPLRGVAKNAGEAGKENKRAQG